MASPTKYLELTIDVFDQRSQRAQVVPDITAKDLVGAILDEFRADLNYLGADAAGYRLRREPNRETLEEGKALGDLLANGDHLVLEEHDQALPQGTERPSRPIYLQDVTSGQTYRIGWQPAFVGRYDELMEFNDLVAVELSVAAGGSRVSRRHLKLWEEDGHFFVRAASTNPVAIVRPDNTVVTVPRDGQVRIEPKDMIQLERSGLSLKFIVREA
ncbi:MAG TPA: hypothetical protein VGL99_21240 [Chloroflexota bacterium]|jgi:hypothetical protein